MYRTKNCLERLLPVRYEEVSSKWQRNRGSRVSCDDKAFGLVTKSLDLLVSCINLSTTRSSSVVQCFADHVIYVVRIFLIIILITRRQPTPLDDAKLKIATCILRFNEFINSDISFRWHTASNYVLLYRSIKIKTGE